LSNECTIFVIIFQISEIKRELEKMKKQLPSDDGNASLLEDLRTRLVTQNKIIKALNQHVSKLGGQEGENLQLKKENELLEYQMSELRKKLELAQAMGKPVREDSRNFWRGN